MNSFNYRIYYEYDDSSKAEPASQPKNEDEIKFALERVEFELPVFLEDDKSEISVTPNDSTSIFLKVSTPKIEADLHKALNKCMKGLDLHIQKQ